MLSSCFTNSNQFRKFKRLHSLIFSNTMKRVPVLKMSYLQCCNHVKWSSLRRFLALWMLWSRTRRFHAVSRQTVAAVTKHSGKLSKTKQNNRRQFWRIERQTKEEEKSARPSFRRQRVTRVSISLREIKIHLTKARSRNVTLPQFSFSLCQCVLRHSHAKAIKTRAYLSRITTPR